MAKQSNLQSAHGKPDSLLVQLEPLDRIES